MKITKELEQKIRSAAVLEMARIGNPDLQITGMTSMDDIVELFESGKTEFYSSQQVAELMASLTVQLMKRGMIK